MRAPPFDALTDPGLLARQSLHIERYNSTINASFGGSKVISDSLRHLGESPGRQLHLYFPLGYRGVSHAYQRLSPINEIVRQLNRPQTPS
jgi:hypothetical protein